MNRSETDIAQIVNTIAIPVTLVIVFWLMGNLIAAYFVERARKRNKEDILSVAKLNRVNAIESTIQSSKIFEKIDRTNELVEGHHLQALAETKIQFWISVVAATVGFICILYFAFAPASDTTEKVLKVLPGVVMGAVASLFFNQMEKTRKRATEFFNKIEVSDRQRMASEIAGSIQECLTWRTKVSVRAMLVSIFDGIFLYQQSYH